MYEYSRVSGVGALPPRATAYNLPPAMGWTGGFTIPEPSLDMDFATDADVVAAGLDPGQRFSRQTCSGSAAVPMDSSSDLICGMSSEVTYLNRIGCVPVGFRGSHDCLTDAGNQGIFFCCPPGVLQEQMRQAAQRPPGDDPDAPEEEGRSLWQTGLFIGLSALALAALGTVVYADWKDKQDERF